MEEHAVVDRIVDERYAVLLVGEAEHEHIVSLSALPPDTQPGTWLKVEFDGDQLITAVVDEEYTRRVMGRVREKLAQLRKRGRQSRR